MEYYLTKYEVSFSMIFFRILRSDFIKNLQEAFEGGAEKIKQFQHAMDDDIERGEKLKAGLVADGWGGKALI